MVKTTGPLMSLAASGSLADAITFSSNRGRSYVRRHVKPSNPKSGAQIGRRAMMKFLSQAWGSISGADQATWQDLAEQLVAAPFNAYLSYNLERWHNFLAPSTVYPATGILDGSDNVIVASTQETNRTKLTLAGGLLRDAWGIAIFVNLGSGFDPAVGICIICEPDTTIATHYIYWTPPDSQLYTFDSIAFSTDGKQEAAGGEFPPPP